MSKRRLTQQQAKRIQHNKAEAIGFEGLVISRFGQYVELETQEGVRLLCTQRPHLDSIVAGDRVRWQPSTALENNPSTSGVIVALIPRDSLLARVDKRGISKPIAANITQLCVVTATVPTLSWPLLDSYLVIAELLGLKACIIHNKVDLKPLDHLETLEAIYTPLAYPIIKASVKTLNQNESLLPALIHETSVFVGQSGVGKSSLIQNILPEHANIATGALAANNTGQHTTSCTTWFSLPSGGAIIDSPGIREFNLSHLGKQPLAHGFREFKPYLGLCKFRNCNHVDIPGCAILNAVKNQLISPQRYKNYARIIEEYSK
jgi:ribosome biogenesis GTPase